MAQILYCFPWIFRFFVFKDCFWWKWNRNLDLIPIVKFIYSPLSPYSDTGNMYIYEFIQTCLLLLILEHTQVHFSLLMRMYGSSKTVEGTTFPLNSLWRWERERTGFFVSKRCHYSRNRHWHLDLYPPALGTIPFGYWASRVLGPSSKARDGAGLYT